MSIIPKFSPQTKTRRILVSIEIPPPVDVRQVPGFIKSAISRAIEAAPIGTGFHYLNAATVRAKSVAWKPKRSRPKNGVY